MPPHRGRPPGAAKQVVRVLLRSGQMRLTLRSLTLRALFILSSISFALAGAGCKGGLGPGGGNDGGEPSTLACTTSSDCTRTEIDHEIHSAADCVCLYGCPFAIVNVETANHLYRIENRGGGEVLISGHPKICPAPVLVSFHGSTWGTPMLKLRFIGRDMSMEFRHPEQGVVRTSRVRDIRQRT